MPKRTLRSQMLTQRRSLSCVSWSASSLLAQTGLLSLDEYGRAECIALYSPSKNEVDTSLLLAEALKAGKMVLYPAVCGNRMTFHRIKQPDELREGAFGILEPCSEGVACKIAEIDLIVVPGVVFDLSGHRIGYGKGYYDRFLQNSGCTANLVGLCHDFQLTEEPIPADIHDIPMGIIVSDKRIIRTTHSSPLAEK